MDLVEEFTRRLWIAAIGMSWVYFALRMALEFRGALRKAKHQEPRVAVPGRIRSSQIVREHGLYRALIEYSFDFGGREWVGDRHATVTRSSSLKGPAEAEAARFPPQAEVTVYVRPSDPQDCTLEPGDTDDPKHRKLETALLVGLVGTAGIGMVVFSILRGHLDE